MPSTPNWATNVVAWVDSTSFECNKNRHLHLLNVKLAFDVSMKDERLSDGIHLVIVLVRSVDQILHFNLLPASLVASMAHAARILHSEGRGNISLSTAPGGPHLVAEA